jgi:hypothetical protein
MNQAGVPTVEIRQVTHQNDGAEIKKTREISSQKTGRWYTACRILGHISPPVSAFGAPKNRRLPTGS